MKFVALSIALLVAVPAFADDAMTKAAGDFYTTARSTGSGLPDAAGRAKLAPFITPSLGSLLNDAATAEEGFMSGNNGAPPMVEGDLYSSLFEGPTSFAIGECSGNAKTAHCAVNLSYDDKSAKAPTRWTDTLYLANTADGWKVDDIGYGGTWAFGNTGRLSETLKQVAGFSAQ
jgi:hypothetical protein